MEDVCHYTKGLDVSNEWEDACEKYKNARQKI